MKANPFMLLSISALVAVIFLVAAIFAMPARGDDTKALNTQSQLEALVEKYIAHRGAKSEMLDSRSENIRTSAIRSCKLANFCQGHKEALVKEMLANNIEPKPYKVSRFLKEKYSMVTLAKE